jgi:hypothetical protein
MGKRMQLGEFCYGRSGDKGSDTNVGIWAKTDAGYQVLIKALTPAVVKKHFSKIAKGDVTRYELPKLRALNFIVGDSLDGGGSATLRTDAQGKTHANGLLLLEVDVPDDFTG